MWDLQEFYMESQPGFSLKDQNEKVRLKKLYGLKHPPRALFDQFSQAMLKINYKKYNARPHIVRE